MRRDMARWMLAAAMCLIAEQAAADARRPPIGNWLTQDGDGVVQIYNCPDGLCGRIVGMSEVFRPDGRRPVDRAGRLQCGLTILRQTGQSDTDVWDGKITNPDDGSTWNCEFWVEADGLHLRGYVLVSLLGQTQVWRPYTGQLRSDCSML